MDNYKIGILVPTTTNMRNWESLKDTTLFDIFLKVF